MSEPAGDCPDCGGNGEYWTDEDGGFMQVCHCDTPQVDTLTCPRCGAKDSEDNGCGEYSVDLTLLCVNRVPWADSVTADGGGSKDDDGSYDAATDTTICGEQWNPNDDYRVEDE
jgi:hypothetical protein